MDMKDDDIGCIAVIGMAGRFPGANGIEEFWYNLQHGIESISFPSREELLVQGADPRLLRHPNFVGAEGRIGHIDLFDAAFFGYSPREAEITDPQQRLFIECAWQALEHAGYNVQTLQVPVGVFAGTSQSTYFLANLYPQPDLIEIVGHAQVQLGNRQDHLAPHVSYKLNLRGPSLTVQTACSTSLVAVHLACQSLQNYQCDMVLAGGVSISVAPGYIYQEGGIYSPDGHCRPFDAQAKGTVGGNGLGIVVLKRLADALVEGDSIYAVIKGSAINNDGSHKVGYTAPSIQGQSEVIAEALALANVSAETIDYIETHGTGTLLGDPIEIAALQRAFSSHTQKKGWCAIGSVKSNIGHLDAASGVTGLIKTVLALHHRAIPPSLHFQTPNPQIDFAHSPFYVNTQLTPWEHKDHPRRAGVSSFGMGGTNVHMILEEAPEPALAGSGNSIERSWHLLPLSARSSPALDKATELMLNHLKSHPEQDIVDISYTLQVGRKAFAHRRVLLCQSQQHAIDVLENSSPELLFSGVEQPHPCIAFLFPGQGVQYTGMASDLYREFAFFRACIDECATLLFPHINQDIRTVLYPDTTGDTAALHTIHQTWLTQPALFAVEYALARLWMHWGIEPAAMLGHSLGEYVAACLAGVFRLEDALKLVSLRGRLMQQMPEGAMLAVPLSEEQLRPRLTAVLAIAAVNGPAQCVVSGALDAIAMLKTQLKEEGIESSLLRTSHAFHSPLLDPLLTPFREYIQNIPLSPPHIPYISNISGTWITDHQATDPAYWVSQLRQTVRFHDGLLELLQQANPLLLEVGPGKTLSTLAKRHAAHSSLLAICSLPAEASKRTDGEQIGIALGQIWLLGCPINWDNYWESVQPTRVPLPTYPFERMRYWIDPPTHAPQSAEPPARQTEEERAFLENIPSTTIPATHTKPMLSTTFMTPRNDIEQLLVDIFQHILGIADIGVLDDFLELGMDSLTAIQIVSRLRSLLIVELPLSQLFEAKTIAALADELVRVEATPGRTAKIARLRRKVGSLSSEEVRTLLQQKAGNQP